MSQGPAVDSETILRALRRMTMAEARTLVAIASTGSLSAASRAVGMSQPALSQHVRELEAKLDLRLFDRHRRGLDPTPHGAALLRFAKALQAELAATADELVAASTRVTPRLRIGCQTTASGGVLALAAGRFALAAPNCGTLIIEERRDLSIEKLRRGHIDFFVGRLPEEAGNAGLASEVLFNEAAVLVCAGDHPLARRTRLSFDQLAPQPWVLPAEGTAFHAQLKDTFRHGGRVLPVPRVETRSIVAIATVVGASRMLGFLPASVFACGALANLRALPVRFDWTPAAIGVLWNPKVVVPPFAERFLECLREVSAGRIAAGASRLATV